MGHALIRLHRTPICAEEGHAATSAPVSCSTIRRFLRFTSLCELSASVLARRAKGGLAF